jgi:Leucine-rich repeat (LRR) protein
MRCTALLFSVLLILYCSSDDDTVVSTNKTFVPNNTFEHYLIDEGYDDVLDDYVLIANISSVENINVDFTGVVDLIGIENFTALKSLSAGDNSIPSINFQTILM